MTGCIAQVLHSTLTAAAEASHTPESVGATTSTWRGKSCKNLELSYGFMAEDQRKSAASGDSFSAKTSGWQMDAINQVRTEQGCIAGAAGVKVPANGQVIAYGYCYAGDDEHQYLTPVFTYGDYYADSGAAESDAFRAMLMSTYGSTGNGACLMEDSPTKAQAAIERKASLTNLQFRDTVRVAWTPPPMVKAPKASIAATSAIVPGKTTTTTPIAGSNLDVLTLGLILETPSPELVKALGLKDNSGAWVVSVTPGSPAAKAGIKPMDVIQDLSGQMVTAPNDVQTIAGKLRADYKAPLGVWRDRSNHELILTITSGPSPSVATTNTVAVAPAAISAAVQPPAAAGKLYCHAYVFVEKQPGGFQSPIIERAGESQDPAVMMASLSAFVTKVRQQQPDQWRPFSFPLEQCSSPTGYCFANTESSLFKVKQSAAQFCFLTRAEAETDLQKFNTFTPVYQVVN
ncbi:hypothetical protein PS900_00492 [Pseudomonas fluorescens]|uniref:PDZ domain-containing protein n=1 Tax=Pseudomonas fluorescens TaxID=294 RepID=A0A8H2RRN7_PSEFL|nr:hypothetical protein PS900_00492 [Pseudomonas fluorescens]